MGIHSDVVVAMKMGAFNRLPASTREWLKEDCHSTHWACDLESGVKLKDDGVAFRWKCTKWYIGEYPELISLYKDLAREECEDYIILEACSEYPERDESDRGEWYENPWNFYKCVTSTIEEG
tara:strand:+ start:536 stop:901 length:366 start_codon:yes stop_codon:yes gene_type:complete